MKYNYKIIEEKAKKRVKNEYFEHPRKLFIIRQLQKLFLKRCLVSLQKGVSKDLKGHLLQAKRALIRMELTPF